LRKFQSVQGEDGAFLHCPAIFEAIRMDRESLYIPMML
jgi:hypothetical protein